MDKILLIDKKVNTTSYDVVRQVKRLVHSRKVGHCGTLDPFASGLLIVAFNQATKVLNFLEHDYKEYVATIKFGKLTDTYDLTGKVVNEKDVIICNDKQINEVFDSFKGEIKQTPPIYSAIHIDGKHLYEYARENIEVEIPERTVTIFDLKLLSNDSDKIKIYVKCSRGTYIRTLGVDIAAKLNNLGYLTELRRISIGGISVDDADLFDDVIEGNVHYHDIKDILKFKQVLITDNKTLKKIYNGQEICLENINDEYVLIIDENNAVAIYNLVEGNMYHCIRGLYNEDIRFKRLEELSR